MVKKVTRFYDIDSHETITIDQLFTEYKQAIDAGTIDEYTMFDEYIMNSLTIFGGTLKEID